MQDNAVVGVDGCPGGWIAIRHSGAFQLCSNFQDLVAAFPDALLYVDIPMGLPSAVPRSLEAKARRLMASRRSSIFSIPCRDAVYAGSYKEACEINAKCFGKRLSLQAWHICKKIREVDQVLLAAPDLHSQIYESHPELTFQELNGGQPLRASKKTPDGIEERLCLLNAYLPAADLLFQTILCEYPRKQVGRDDIVDALALVVTGKVPRKIIGDEGETDEQGLPIRMVIPDINFIHRASSG